MSECGGEDISHAGKRGKPSWQMRELSTVLDRPLQSDAFPCEVNWGVDEPCTHRNRPATGSQRVSNGPASSIGQLLRSAQVTQ